MTSEPGALVRRGTAAGPSAARVRRGATAGPFAARMRRGSAAGRLEAPEDRGSAAVLLAALVRRGAAAVLLAALACGGDDAPPPPPDRPPEGVHGQAPPAVGGVPSVVLLAPVGGADAAEDPNGPAASGTVAAPARGPGAAPVLDQFGLTFSPRALVVRAGEPFTVTNSEQLAHNVTIRAGGTDSVVFNADTDSGDRIDVTLDEPGPYHVTCNVHPGMTAFIFAADAPYGAVARADGTFVVEGVPPGRYTLTVWSADAALGGTREVEVAAGSTEVTLVPGG